MHARTRADAPLFTPGLVHSIREGKYVRWAARLRAARLARLCGVVDAYARAHAAFLEEHGCPPEWRWTNGSSDEFRLTHALGILALLPGLPPGSREHLLPGYALDNERPALPSRLRARLVARTPSLEWAAQLTEARLLQLLWQAGEYGMRVPGRHDLFAFGFVQEVLPASATATRLERCARLIGELVHQAQA